ncbi:MAG TPA: tripartite tricarboxylate transporter substrate binding protein [Pseudolabrys sp.]|nr:tripartite tricarboxylate transporter substrate binding protein [Pseudolabrys sp.]
MRRGFARLTAFALLAGAAALSLPAAAQNYPDRPIHFYISSGPGTPPDIIMRVIADALGRDEHWTVVPENKQGASQTIAGNEVLRRPADGYTVYGFSMPVTAAPALLERMPFSLEKDFAPVVRLTTSYNVLVVPPSSPVHKIGDLVTLLKQNPGKMTFSSGGFGSPAHLVGEMFKLREGVSAVHVPYARMPQAIGDLMNGTNQFMFITTLPVVGLINAGKLHAIAVTAPHRVAALPDIPTVGEQGHPGLVAMDWVGLAVKAGTPQPIVARINMAVNKALATPEVRAALAKIGAEPAGGTPEAFGELIASQTAHWSKVVKESGIKISQ